MLSLGKTYRVVPCTSTQCVGIDECVLCRHFADVRQQSVARDLCWKTTDDGRRTIGRWQPKKKRPKSVAPRKRKCEGLEVVGRTDGRTSEVVSSRVCGFVVAA